MYVELFVGSLVLLLAIVFWPWRTKSDDHLEWK
jgi:hypothetical protein